MKNVLGAPGTLTGLVLRIVQCLFAAGSIAAMASTGSFFNYTAFCFLVPAMGVQVIWSFGLASLDTLALIKGKNFGFYILVCLLLVGDGVTAMLSLAAASASAGVTVLYFSDLGPCKFGEECRKYQVAVLLAFLARLTMAISGLIMLWILAPT